MIHQSSRPRSSKGDVARYLKQPRIEDRGRLTPAGVERGVDGENPTAVQRIVASRFSCSRRRGVSWKILLSRRSSREIRGSKSVFGVINGTVAVRVPPDRSAAKRRPDLGRRRR